MDGEGGLWVEAGVEKKNDERKGGREGRIKEDELNNKLEKGDLRSR